MEKLQSTENEFVVASRRDGKVNAMAKLLATKLMNDPDIPFSITPPSEALKILSDVYKELALLGAKAQREGDKITDMFVDRARDAVRRKAEAIKQETNNQT